MELSERSLGCSLITKFASVKVRVSGPRAKDLAPVPFSLGLLVRLWRGGPDLLTPSISTKRAPFRPKIGKAVVWMLGIKEIFTAF